MRGVALLLALVGAGCGASASAPAASDRFRDVAAEPAVAAAAARAEAASREAAVVGPVEGVELRAGNLGEGQTAPGGNFELGGRVNLTSPFEMAAQGRAATAEVEHAAAVLDAAALGVLVGRCDADMERAAASARRVVAAAAARRLGDLEAWVSGLGKANLLPVTTLLELKMELGLVRVSAAPGAASTALPLFALPDDTWGDRAWSATTEQLDAMIERYNADLAMRRAAERRFEALADREGAAALPWVNFVEVDYQPHNDDPVRGDYTARLSVELPLSGEVGAAADGMRARARAESLDGEALRLEMREAAEQALTVLSTYAERRTVWADLLAAAAEAEQVADAGIASRKGAVDDLFSLARRAQEVRLRELAWREEVGKAGCSLLAATGVRPEQFAASLTQ